VLGGPLESYAAVLPDARGAAVFLSDEALRAVVAAFGPPADQTYARADALPAGVVPTLPLQARVPRGQAEVLSALERAIAL
jgi:hypothetical protein